MSGTPVESIVGFIDECRPDHEVGSIDGNPIVLPGDRLTVRGWALAHDHSRIATELEIGDRTVPLGRTIERPDLPATTGGPSGFETTVDIPPPARGLSVPIALTVVAGGARRTVGAVRRVVPARELAPSDEPLPPMRTPHGRFRTVADADPSHPRHGWGGRRSMRWNSAIAVRGWILDAALRPPSRVWLVVEGAGARFRAEAALVGDGEATAAAGGDNWFEAGFACALAPWTLEPGLYGITAVLETADGTQAQGPTEAFQVVEDDHWEPPLYLPVGVAASPEGADVGPLSVVRGRPVVVRGSALDPATGRPAAVFVRFDDGRALPVPTVPDDPSRFGGIADTEVLSPGMHRLQVLLQPVYPGYWHLIAEYRITVAARS